MAVTSKDIGPTTRRNAPLEPGGIGGFSIGFVGMLMSAVIWVLGARWTVDGLIVMFNAILRFLNMSYQAPIPPAFLVYAFLCPLPIIFSVVEWRVPFKRTDGEWYFANPGAWVVWMGVGLFDWYTTYLGLGVNPGPGSPTIMSQVAASSVLRGLVSAVLTAGPEWLARTMWDMLRYVFTGRRSK
ncbi:hypothetical protein EKD04_009700 [Chloroflexales bacterium ZM16-3]|nr:hypothetical protein [Chloroflexales bacterium ZM16-3]